MPGVCAAVGSGGGSLVDEAAAQKEHAEHLHEAQFLAWHQSWHTHAAAFVLLRTADAAAGLL